MFFLLVFWGYTFLPILLIIKDHLVLFPTQDVLGKAFSSRGVHNSTSSSPKNSCGWGIFDKPVKSWWGREREKERERTILYGINTKNKPPLVKNPQAENKKFYNENHRQSFCYCCYYMEIIWFKSVSNNAVAS